MADNPQLDAAALDGADANVAGDAGRRRWPLLLIGASAGTATWSGWVGLGELTGFGVVHPLPGIWEDLTLNTAITLPVGVEAYAVYALAVATDARPLTPLARRWAWGSAAGALLLGMGGQIAFHLLAARGVTAAPTWVVALVSSLPVLVLGAASLLWHLAATGPRTAGEYECAEPSPASGVAVSVTAEPLVATAGPVPGAGVLHAGSDAQPEERSTPGPLGITGPNTVPDAGEALGAVEYADWHPVGAGRRPTAAERQTPGPQRVTARLESPSDAEILAAVACGHDNEPPSIRALMRTYAIGQKRATRIHHQASKNQHQQTKNHQQEINEPKNHDIQNPEITEEDDTIKITREVRPETSNSPQQESQRTTSRNHTLASPTE